MPPADRPPTPTPTPHPPPRSPRPSGGRHVTTRKPIQLPAAWLDVIQRLAAARPMPAVWLVIEWARERAVAAGAGVEELPAVPWEQGTAGATASGGGGVAGERTNK